MAGGAILDLNPSLVQYIGGYGRAAKAIGDSMVGVGQLEIDAKKQREDERIKNAQLTLLQNADTRAGEAVTRSEKDKFDLKNEKYAANATTNAFLMGQEPPTEMSNDYAKLSLIDPTITAAALKGEKEKYSGTAGGIIFNTGTGAVAGDYRDKSGSKELDGLPSVRSIVGGKERLTYFNPDGSVKLRVNGDGTPIGVYGQQVGDAIGDENTYQRPTITNTVKQDIGGSNAVAKGGMPITFAKDPKIAAEQKKWALPIEGGGWYVPRDMAERYKKVFPR